MKSHEKALKNAKVSNMVVKKQKDEKGVKAKMPYKFLKNNGAKEEK